MKWYAWCWTFNSGLIQFSCSLSDQSWQECELILDLFIQGAAILLLTSTCMAASRGSEQYEPCPATPHHATLRYTTPHHTTLHHATPEERGDLCRPATQLTVSQSDNTAAHESSRALLTTRLKHGAPGQTPQARTGSPSHRQPWLSSDGAYGWLCQGYALCIRVNKYIVCVIACVLAQMHWKILE